MRTQHWMLTNVADQVYVPELKIDSGQIPGAPARFHVLKHQWQSGLSQGVDEIRIHNGQFEFSVLPTRGMGIWRGWWGEQSVGWRSPVRGPVHPAFVPLTEPSGLGWLDGFDEWICRCGASSNGAPDFDAQGRLIFPLHGRLANLPAHQVELEINDQGIVVRGVVDECRFHFQKLRLTTTISTSFDEPGLQIRDEIQNLSDSAGHTQMLYHCNFGPPWLAAGSELVVPAETVVPRNDESARSLGHWSTFSAATPGRPEHVYFLRLLSDASHSTRALLKTAGGNQGISLSWDVRQLPCFTLWKNETGLADGYVTGLEPATNFPNPHRFETERGRVVQLEPGQSHVMRLDFQVHPDRAAVEAIEQQIDQIRAGRQPQISQQPLADWCA